MAGRINRLTGLRMSHLVFYRSPRFGRRETQATVIRHPRKDNSMMQTPRGISPLQYRDVPGGTQDVTWQELAPSEPVHTRDALVDLALQPNLATPLDELAIRRTLPRGYEAAPVDLLHIAGAWIETRMAVAITPDHKYVVDTLRSHRQATQLGYGETAPGRFVLPDQDVTEIAGRALLVGLPVGRNYFHWTFEAVARWLFARDHLPPDTQLLTPALGAMELATLAAVGAPEDRLVIMPESAFLRVEDLAVAPRGIRSSVQILPAAVRALRAVVPASKQPRQRLYISRVDARRRRIVNESAVVDVVERHGFRVLQSEQLDVRDQLKLFSEAEAVVGMHGAGLSNCVYAPCDATVVELQPGGLDKARLILYWNQAAASGQRYVQIVCAEAPEQADVPPSERDIVVDPVHLDVVLARALPMPL